MIAFRDYQTATLAAVETRAADVLASGRPHSAMQSTVTDRSA
jgi:hypothetical protein